MNMPLYDPALSERHVADSAQKILLLTRARSGDRGLHVVDPDSFVMLALWSLVRWERKVGLLALERMAVDLDNLTRDLNHLLDQKATEDPVSALGGSLVLKSTRQPYEGWEFHAVLEPLLAQAEHEAHALGHKYVGSEHLLLAMLTLADPSLGGLLQSYAVTHERVKQTVLSLLKH